MNRALFAAVCVTSVAHAACSSPVEPVDPPLTHIDAARAAYAYSTFGSREFLLTPATPAPDEPGAFACPGGGSHRTTLGPEGASPMRASFILKNCVLADSTGQRWTFTTLPQLDLATTFVSTDSVSTTVNVTTGTMRVESGTARGTCRIDIRKEVVMNYNERSIRVKQSGTYCGQSADEAWGGALISN